MFSEKYHEIKEMLINGLGTTSVGREIIYKYILKKKYPNWIRLIRQDKQLWNQYLTSSQKCDNILLAESVGGFFATQSINSLLAVALTLRGFKVHVLLCDSILSACNLLTTNSFKNKDILSIRSMKKICERCYVPALKLYSRIGVSVYKYSDFITKEDLEFVDIQASKVNLDNLGSFVFNGLAIGEHALAGALRFFAKSSLAEENDSDAVLIKFLKAALLTYIVCNKLISKIAFKSIVSSHGIYIPWGIIGEVSRKKKINLVNWNYSYRKKTFIFSHNDTYHHTLMDEDVEKWENMKWTSEIEEKIFKYLKGRWYGTEDWISFQYKPEFKLDAIEKKLGVDFSKPVIGMLTNVMWDAQLHYPANAFSSMIEWTIETIKYFAQRRDLQLLIRIHPAELRGALVSRQPLFEEIKKYINTIPDNVFIIPPESTISTYVAMSRCNCVIIYGTKTGVELTSMGIPIIVAGEAWIRNKGLTIDVESQEEYTKILNTLPLTVKLDDASIERARKYAFHFFFRRMIPLEFIIDDNKPLAIKLELHSLEDLLPGRSSGLDIICDGITKKCDFIYPAEKK